MVSKKGSNPFSGYWNRFHISRQYPIYEVLKMEIIGLTKRNVAGDEKLENFILYYLRGDLVTFAFSARPFEE